MRPVIYPARGGVSYEVERRVLSLMAHTFPYTLFELQGQQYKILL